MGKKKRNQKVPDTAVAPGIDEEDVYGVHATKEEIDRGEYTPVTRLVYDEYNPSKK